MKVGVIGAGNVGRALAKGAVRAGHSVKISATSAENAAAAAAETGAQAAESNSAAVEDSDVVILAVPHHAVGEILAQVAPLLNGRTVVDATNPIKPDGSGLAVEGTSGAEEIQSRFQDARVIKAFNTILAANQENPTGPGLQLDGFVAGDDPEAKAGVVELVRTMGFRPIDAGPLRAARTLEGMAFINISLNATNGWPWQSGWKLIGPTG